MHTHLKTATNVFFEFVEAYICFKKLSEQVNESQGLVTFLLQLTNPSYTDITTMTIINTINGKTIVYLSHM